MSIRQLAAFAVAAAFSGSAAAQSDAAFRHPQGWSLTLPAGVSAPADAAKENSASFLIERGGATVGVCVITVTTLPQPLTPAGWDQISGPQAANPEATARRYAERTGHPFVRLLGGGAVRAASGWNGHEVWYERTSKTSGQLQTSYNSLIMVDANRRAVGVCNSLPNLMLAPEDIQRVRTLNASIRP